MEHHHGMNSDVHEESSPNADEVRSTEQKPGLDSRDVDMKPVSPGGHHPAATSTAPTTPEVSKKSSSKRGKLRVVRLHLFHKRRKASSVESSIDGDGVLFGQSLETICLPQTDPVLPPPLLALLLTLYVSGPTAEGIFRRCANKSTCRSVRKQLDSGVDCGPIDVHVASNLFTELLRKLPDCLLCCRMYDQWLESSSKTDEEDRISSLRQLVRGLPVCNQLLLRHLICVLHRIDGHSEQTKMTSMNLAVCLGPSLLWSKTTTLDHQRRDVDRTVAAVKTLIDRAVDIFGSDCLHLFRGLSRADSISDPSNDHRAGDMRIESTEFSPNECITGSNEALSTSQADALALTSLDPTPVAPPRRKRSSVVHPPVFVCITEDFTSSAFSDQSANHSIAKQVSDDKQNFSRWFSSDSEMSGREGPAKNYATETTDGETVEDSDETSATEEEDLEGRRRRSSMLSEDLVDEADSSGVSPSVERRKAIFNNQQHLKSDGRPISTDGNLSTLSSAETKSATDFAAMDVGSWTNPAKPRHHAAVSPPTLSGIDHLSSSHSVVKSTLSTEAEQEMKATKKALMSLSSTEESMVGDRWATGQRRLFFGSSVSSTAGSDADISTFAESLDSGTALSESFELEGVIRRRRKTDMDGVSSSIVVLTPLSREDCCNPDNSGSRHRRGCQSQIDDSREVRSPVKTTEHRIQRDAISDSATDLCISGISSVESVSGKTSSNGTKQEIDPKSDQIYFPKSVHALDTVEEPSALISRRHSIGHRDQGSVTDISVVQTRQRRGMTHKGSDVFPGILSRTLGQRATRVHDPNGFRHLIGTSGAKSENEEGGRIYYPGRNLTSDERIIVSDIEFSESSGRTQQAPRRGNRAEKGCQNLGSSGAVLLPLAIQDGRQLDGDVEELDTAKAPLSGVNEEDEEKNSNARRSRLEPPNYEEAVRQLRNQRQTSSRASVSTPGESVIQEERQIEGERSAAKLEEKEKKKKPAEDHSTQPKSVELVGRGLDASALARLAARSCGDLSKTTERNAPDDSTKLPRREHGTRLKYVRSLGALTAEESLRKKFCIPRSRRFSIRDSTSSSSSTDEGDTSQLRLENNAGKKRLRRKRCRRLRKARNSDTRLQTERENRVNLVRSKSDSNTLLRELIVRQENAEEVRESFRKEISRRKANQKRISRDVFQDRQDGKENLNDVTIRVKLSGKDDPATRDLPSKTSEGNRRSLALKDREWHKELVREVETTQNSQSAHHPTFGTPPLSGSEGRWQRKTNDSGRNSADNFKHSNNNLAAVSTIPRTSKCISKTRQGQALDYSSSESAKRSTDKATRISERARCQSPHDSGERHLGESVSYCGDSGSGGSTTSLIERFRKSGRDCQSDSSRAKEAIATKYSLEEDNSNNFMKNARGNFLGVQTLNQRTNTLSSDTEPANARNSLKGKTEMHSSQEFTANSSRTDEDDVDLPETTSSDLSKSSTSQFERISVKDIVAKKNSSSSRNDPTIPLLSSFSRRSEGRTEAGRLEGWRPVTRRASHVIPQVKSEVDISLTPELNRKMSSKTEQKSHVSVEASTSRKNPCGSSPFLPLPVCARSQSVKSSSIREIEVRQKKNAADAEVQRSAGVEAATSDPSQRQRHVGSSKQWPPRQAALASSSLSVESSTESLRKDVASGADHKELDVRPSTNVCANEMGDRRVDSEYTGDTADKSTKADMPWSVANLRSRYGNQNPQ